MVSVLQKSTKKLFSLGLSSRSSSGAGATDASSDLRRPISPSAGGSDDIDPALEAEYNREIERYLSEAGKKASRIMSVMLIGPGESGKSTFMKQLAKIHAGEVSSHTLMLSRASIRQNIVEGMQVLCRLSQKLSARQPSPALGPTIELKSSDSGVPTASLASKSSQSPPLVATEPVTVEVDDTGDPRVRRATSIDEMVALSDGAGTADSVVDGMIIDMFDERCTMVDPESIEIRDSVLRLFDSRSVDQDMCELVTRDVRMQLDKLWLDTSIQFLYSIRHTFQLAQVPYHLEYFMNRSFIIWEDDYVPTFDDYIKVRVRSTGIREEIYHHRTDDGKRKSKKDGLRFRFIDVGGQRSERRKWMARFDAIASVYIFGIGDYNLFCFEDGTTRRLVEALTLFEQLCARQLKSSDLRRLGSLSSSSSRHKKSSSPPPGPADGSGSDIGSTFFDNHSLIIFFNKWDVLEKKLKSGNYPFEMAFAPSPALSESLMLDSTLPPGSGLPTLALGSSSGTAGKFSGSLSSVKGSASPRSGFGSICGRMTDTLYTQEKIEQLHKLAADCGNDPKKVSLMMQKEMESVIKHYKPRIIAGSAAFHRTRATSTSNAQKVMRSVQKRIIQQSLTEFGLA